MSDEGYIYVKSWDKRQQGRPENAQWHKSWNSVLRDDRYLSLTLAQRGLLHDLWALVSASGEGRVPASRQYLGNMLAVWSQGESSHLARNLKLLEQAGFISIGLRATSGRPTAREEENRRDLTLNPAKRDRINPRANGTNPRALGTNPRAAGAKRKRQGAVQRCRYLWHKGLEEGELPEALRTSLEYEYHHDKTIVTEAIGAE